MVKFYEFEIFGKFFLDKRSKTEGGYNDDGGVGGGGDDESWKEGNNYFV